MGRTEGPADHIPQRRPLLFVSHFYRTSTNRCRVTQSDPEAPPPQPLRSRPPAPVAAMCAHSPGCKGKGLGAGVGEGAVEEECVPCGFPAGADSVSLSNLSFMIQQH